MKHKKRRLNTKQKILLVVTAAIIIAAVTLITLYYFGILHINVPNRKKYPVSGVDLSAYQGKVDWETLSSNNIRFAFIKATEGSGHVDEMFQKNWEEAAKTNLRIGAYHFFSFESTGKKQAELFCDTVKSVSNMLPPVIDVEYYGSFSSAEKIDIPKAKKELRSLIDLLEEEYGMKPIVYANEYTYNSIIKNDFDDCDLWYRSIYQPVPGEIEWTFWQHSNRYVLKGYKGLERYIDMNVFAGTAEEFAAYPAK